MLEETMQIDTPWKESAVFFCTKCSKEIESPRFGVSISENVGETLKTHLKQKLSETNRQKDVRIMSSSCLGVCPSGRQAAVKFDKQNRTEVLIFEATETLSEACDSILSRLRL